jgi:hypothetical protein
MRLREARWSTLRARDELSRTMVDVPWLSIVPDACYVRAGNRAVNSWQIPHSLQGRALHNSPGAGFFEGSAVPLMRNGHALVNCSREPVLKFGSPDRAPSVAGRTARRDLRVCPSGVLFSEGFVLRLSRIATPSPT